MQQQADETLGVPLTPPGRRFVVAKVPLEESVFWRSIGILAALLVVQWLLMWNFSATLDRADPSAVQLVPRLLLMAAVAFGIGALVVQEIRAGRLDRNGVVSLLAVGALVGLFYGIQVYPEDFSDKFLFGRMFGLFLAHLFVLFPLGAILAIVGLVRWRRRREQRPELDAALVTAPLTLMVAFHGAWLVVAALTLQSLMEQARRIHEESPAPALALLLIAILASAWLRRRGL